MKTTKNMLAGVLLTACVCATSALAQSTTPDFIVTFVPGKACPSFGLEVDGFNSDHQVMKLFTDKNGNPGRFLIAGRGATLVFTNLSTQKQLSLKSNGSVSNIAFNADGTQTWAVTGHNVLILFPGDHPPGPSTILYIGRLVFLQTPIPGSQDQITTLLSTPAGTQKTDICEVLS